MQLLKPIKEGLRNLGHQLTAKEELMLTLLEKEFDKVIFTEERYKTRVTPITEVPTEKMLIEETASAKEDKKDAIAAFKEANPSQPVPKAITQARKLTLPEKKIDPIDAILNKAN